MTFICVRWTVRVPCSGIKCRPIDHVLACIKTVTASYLLSKNPWRAVLRHQFIFLVFKFPLSFDCISTEAF